MSARERRPAVRASRIPALIAALAVTGPIVAAAGPAGRGHDAGVRANTTTDAGAGDASAGDAGSKDASAGDGGETGGEGLVRLEGRELYRGLSVDAQPRDELLKAEPFPLPAGSHVLRITRSDGSAYDVTVLVRAGETAVVPRSECEPLGGVQIPVEPRPSGCCGGGSTSNETAGRYGLLGTAAVAIAFGRRRKRET